MAENRFKASEEKITVFLPRPKFILNVFAHLLFAKLCFFQALFQEAGSLSKKKKNLKQKLDERGFVQQTFSRILSFVLVAHPVAQTIQKKIKVTTAIERFAPKRTLNKNSSCQIKVVPS